MLVLQRLKGNSIVIDDGVTSDIRIHVLDIYVDNSWGKMVKLGFDFPESYKIYREELACAMKLHMSLDEAREYLCGQKRGYGNNVNI